MPMMLCLVVVLQIFPIYVGVYSAGSAQIGEHAYVQRSLATVAKCRQHTPS